MYLVERYMSFRLNSGHAGGGPAHLADAFGQFGRYDRSERSEQNFVDDVNIVSNKQS